MAKIIGWKSGMGEGEAVKMVKMNELFGLPIGDEHLAQALDRESAITTDKNYYFDPIVLKKMLHWLYGQSARRNLMLIGGAGIGKTSLILEVAGRLNVPVFQMACSGKTRFQNFVGSRELINGQTRWVDGPLTRAMREGGIFLMDEVTRLDAGEQMNLTAVLDGRSSLTVPDTGEVVKPHPLFRIAATGNSAGFGDESGAYVGEKTSSFAFIDRFQKLSIPVMPESVERSLIEKVAPDLPDVVVISMTNLAREVASNFIGVGGGLSVTISPRSLQVWAMEASSYQKMNIENPVWESLMDTVLTGAPENDVSVIKELFDKWL